MRNRKSKALLSLLGLILCGVVVGGITYSLFTNTTTNANNNITAGTLVIDQYRSADTIPGPMFYTAASDPTGDIPYDLDRITMLVEALRGGEALGGWAPGDTVVRSMDVINNGTLDAQITGLKATVNGAGLQPGNAAYEEFIDKMNITVKNTNDDTIIYDASLRGLLVDEGEWIEINPAILALVDQNPINIEFEAHLDLTATNQLQGHDFVFDFTFYAEQLRNNEDVIEEEDIRIVLTWGSSPRDLDAHLTGPKGIGGRFHIRYDDRTYSENDVLHAELDRDVQNGYGPETITIYNPKQTGMYRYSVDKASIFSFTKLKDSGAKVEVYRGDTLVNTFHVSSATGHNSGRVWTVFQIVHGQIYPINTLSNASIQGGERINDDSYMIP